MLMLVAVLFVALPLGAQDGSKGEITTTPHNFAATAGDLCGVCHLPHMSSGQNRTLLWNHVTNTTTAYTAYSSATLNAAVTALNQSSATQQTGPEFYSLSCMSCHDGATANNVVYRVPDGLTGTAAGGAGGGFTIGTAVALTPASNLGSDLANDHPVNFLYDSALATADGGLFTPATPTASGPGYVRAKATGTAGQVTVPVLFNNTVQCATCHNPHNNTTSPFLRKANTGSALCLDCHSTT
jgi:predicted CXXCH cytochrome family protein